MELNPKSLSSRPGMYPPPPTIVTPFHINVSLVSIVGIATGEVVGGGVRQRASAHLRDDRAQGTEGEFVNTLVFGILNTFCLCVSNRSSRLIASQPTITHGMCVSCVSLQNHRSSQACLYSLRAYIIHQVDFDPNPRISWVWFYLSTCNHRLSR